MKHNYFIKKYYFIANMNKIQNKFKDDSFIFFILLISNLISNLQSTYFGYDLVYHLEQFPIY